MRSTLSIIVMGLVALFAAGCGDVDGAAPELDSAAEALLASCGGGSGYELEFDASVDAAQRASLRQDIRVASCLNLTPTNNSQLQAMGLSNFSGASLVSWLRARVKTFVGESYQAESQTTFLAWNYNPQSYLYAEAAGLSDNTTVASNIGMSVFRAAKADSAYYQLSINSERRTVKSGRIGVIKVGPVLFSATNRVPGLPRDALIHSLIRLGTEFHEGRHDDSNGASLGFYHATCPSTYGSLSGESACEKYSNGPYAIQGMFYSLFYNQACSNCTAASREKLRVLQADRSRRVLGNSTWVDDRPEQWQ